MWRWGLGCTNSRIVLEGKEVIWYWVYFSCLLCCEKCNEFPPVFLISRDMDGVLCNGDVMWLHTWGVLNRTNNITRSWVFFFSLYIYHSYIFFHLKESTTVTTDKQRTKRIQQKSIQQCGGQVAPNSIWPGPSNKTEHFFFFFHRRTRVSPLRLYGCTNFNQIGFPPKLAADEQPQKRFFGIVLIQTFI